MVIHVCFLNNKTSLVTLTNIFSHCFRYGMDLNGARRKNATRETTSTLKAWLNEHKKNPYPTKGEKIMLAIITKMTLTQVSTWFANARRRLKKENKMTWEPRNRVEDDDNNNDDDDQDHKSNDGKDIIGKQHIFLNSTKRTDKERRIHIELLISGSFLLHVFYLCLLFQFATLFQPLIVLKYLIKS